VDIADIVAYLAEDPTCASIACLFEGMSDPSRFLEAGEIAWKMGKPVVVSKLAFGEKGAAAAMSHTGLLAGSSKAYQALFERCGIVSLPSLDGLLETASFLAKAPAQPSATGVAVIAASGGAVVAASDMAELYGVPLPQPNQQLHDFLATKVPAFGSVGNPCDCTAAVAGDPDTFLACIEAMLADDAYGTIVIPQAGLSARTHERRKRFSVLAKKLGKPICLPFIGGWTGGPGTTEAEMDGGFGWFYSLDRCFATLAAWHRRAALIDARRQPRQLERLSPPENAARARDLIRAAQNLTPGQPLTERQAKAALSLYGIPVVHEQLERSAKDAAAAASFIGFPVVLKVESPDIPHKTEAGGISLNLKTEQEVAAAFDTIMANARHHAPQARINGVLVQPMAKAGVEVMVGVKRDPLFGPLVLVSLGGVFVELLKDSVVDLAPVNRQEALAMLGKLRGRDIFKGFRGAPPVNLDRLAEVIARVSEFGADQSDELVELDINPLICAGGDCLAVDALIVPDAGRANQ
jgi:acyl-CoA synthetase (NDP forming)